MDAQTIADLLGPTPSAGGMIPKLLVAIPDAPRWDGRFASPGVLQVAGEPYVDVLLKVEPLEYEGIAELEAACLALHQEAGFETPRWWRATLDDLELLAVERFDRTHEGSPIALESFFATFAEGDRRFTNHRDIHLAEVARRLARLGEVVNLDVRQTQQEVFRRQLFALCTGNGDLHLENLSLLGGPDKTRLSPVYDPTPMRAWPRHDLRMAIPLDLDLDDSRPLAASLLEAGRAFGLGPRATRRMAREVLSQTDGYDERLESLPVPGVRIERLQAIAARERRELHDFCWFSRRKKGETRV